MGDSTLLSQLSNLLKGQSPGQGVQSIIDNVSHHLQKSLSEEQISSLEADFYEGVELPARPTPYEIWYEQHGDKSTPRQVEVTFQSIHDYFCFVLNR